MRYSIFLLFVGMGALGCGQSSSGVEGGPQASPDAVPEAADIPGADVEIGTAISRGQTVAHLDGYRVSKYPVTVAQWRQCVDAGACSPPALDIGACRSRAAQDVVRVDGPTWGQLNESPITCVSMQQASSYCSWAGHGHVANVAEWLLATRGAGGLVSRFAWGNTKQGCSHRARLVSSPGIPGACCGLDCADPLVLKVGQRSPGDSPNGLSDVLLTHAELVASRSDSDTQCSTNGCWIYGQEPGAIDWIVPVPSGERSGSFAAAFRCAWAKVAP